MTRRVNLLNYETGKVIKTYESMKEALEEFGLFRANVNKAIISNEGKIPSKRLRFAYADGPNKPVSKYKVIQVDIETGEIIEKYEDAEAAGEDNFITAKTVRNVIKHKDGYVKSRGIRFQYILE